MALECPRQQEQRAFRRRCEVELKSARLWSGRVALSALVDTYYAICRLLGDSEEKIAGRWLWAQGELARVVTRERQQVEREKKSGAGAQDDLKALHAKIAGMG